LSAAHFPPPASAVSGRRRRPLKGSPPSATQTERAVFPHSAFMNGFAKSGEKGSVRQGLPCPPESGPSASDLRASDDRIVSLECDVRVFTKGIFHLHTPFSSISTSPARSIHERPSRNHSRFAVAGHASYSSRASGTITFSDSCLCIASHFAFAYRVAYLV
jgi:hypothetical protein